jgi:hypothetical protein
VFTFLAVVAALVLTLVLPFGSRRRVLCPLSASLGLLCGLSWALVAHLV